MGKLKIYGIIVIAFFVIMLIVYFSGKSIGKAKSKTFKPLKFPRSSTVPEGWSATADAIQLYRAMKGWGTDEETIWGVLEGKNKAQLTAIYNEFGNRYGEDLMAWFEEDLSRDDLARASNYFRGII